MSSNTVYYTVSETAMNMQVAIARSISYQTFSYRIMKDVGTVAAIDLAVSCIELGYIIISFSCLIHSVETKKRREFKLSHMG